MAGSDTTRLLVLGVARLFEPANGYQLRRELLSWRVESWANVNPGSVYSMLTTLTTQGMLERFDIPSTNGKRPVAVYRSTAAGREELVTLVRDALTTVEVFDRTAMYAALSLSVSLLSRKEVVKNLETRVRNLEKSIATHTAETEVNQKLGLSPPHVARMFGFPIAIAAAEIKWMTGFIASTNAGEMLFADDDWSDWKPNPSDPAWRMIAEQAAYLEKIGKPAAR